MKKLIGTLLVVGLLAGGGYYVYNRLMYGSERTCVRLSRLCGHELDGEKLAQCEARMDQLVKVSGKEKARRAAECVARAETCLKGMGCVAGAGLGAATQFLEGLKEGLMGDDEGGK